MRQFLKILCLAIIAGKLFTFVQIPLPWTLGPITAVSLYSLKTGQRVYWPIKIRNVALIVLGYAMGRPFTIETGYKIIEQLPLMLIATVITVLAGIIVGYITYKRTGISLASCLLGCVPGGLSQMVVLAGEMKGTDQTAVTIMQTVRMLSVVFSVPFLTMHFLHDGNPLLAEAASHVLPPTFNDIALYTAVSIIGAFIAKLIKLPTPFMLGPIIMTACFIMLTGLTAPIVPTLYLNIAQVLVGIYIGASINLGKIKNYHGLMPCLLGGVAFVLIISLCTGYLIVQLTGMTFVTGFLSTSPGGVAEMGITALIVGADIATMTAYQLARLLFIMLCFPYIAKFLLRFTTK